MSDITDHTGGPGVEVSLPVVFEGGTGVTRYVSRSELYMITGERLAPSTHLKLLIELFDSAGPLRVQCDANILRVDAVNDGWGVLASIRWHGNGITGVEEC